MTHTPEPWTVKEVESYQLLGGFEPDGYTKREEKRPKYHVAIGDGRLIFCPDKETAIKVAAAPDLLEALKVIAEQVPLEVRMMSERLHDALVKSKQAIAKAEGRD